MDNLGAKLRALRASRKLTQTETAARLGYRRATFGNYETGRRVPPLHELEKIAAFFGVGLDYFAAVSSTDAAEDILQRARLFFAASHVSHDAKSNLHRDLLALYLTNYKGVTK